MGALENPNAINAAAVIVPVPTPDFPTPLVQSRGIASFTRLSAGQYELALQFGLCFGDAVPFVCVPPNTPFNAGAQVTSPGTVRISVLRADNGAPDDPAALFFTVLAMETAGVVPELAIAPNPPEAGGILDLFLDPVDGDDANTGRSEEQAVKTPLRIANLIPLTINGDVEVHMKSGIALLPERGWFLGPRTALGLIHIFADELWDPDVYTVTLTAAALAGTTLYVVKTSGLVVDALAGQSIRFTTGAAAGQYRRIRDNTATDINLIAAFDPAPGVGDIYELFTNNVALQAPESPIESQAIGYTFCGDFSAMPVNNFQTFPPFPGSAPLTGLILDGVNLLPSAGEDYDQFTFGALNLFLYGTELRDPNASIGQASRAVFDDTVVASGTGGLLAGKEGWGLSSDYLGACLGSASIEGYVVIDHLDVRFGDGAPKFRLYGGRSMSLMIGDPGNEEVQGGSGTIEGDYVGGTQKYLIRAAGGNALTVARGNILNLIFTIIEGGSVIVESGGRLYIADSVDGVPTSIALRAGGGVYCRGAVNLGGAGADWAVTGIANFNKGFFGAANTFKLGTDGSLVYRL